MWKLEKKKKNIRQKKPYPHFHNPEASNGNTFPMHMYHLNFKIILSIRVYILS